MWKVASQAYGRLWSNAAQAPPAPVANPYRRPPEAAPRRPAPPRNAVLQTLRGLDVLGWLRRPFRLLALPAELRLAIYDELAQTFPPTELISLADANRALRAEIAPIVDAFAVACSVKTPADVEAFPQRLTALSPRQRLVPLFNFMLHEIGGPLDQGGEVEDAVRQALNQIAPALHGRLGPVLAAPRSQRMAAAWKAATPAERSAYVRSIVFCEREAQGTFGELPWKAVFDKRREVEDGLDLVTSHHRTGALDRFDAQWASADSADARRALSEAGAAAA